MKSNVVKLLSASVMIWIGACMLMPPPLAAADVSDIDLAFRLGIDAYADVEYFHLYEISAKKSFKPYISWGDGWSVAPALVGSLGMLHAAEKDGFIAGIGPRLELDFPWDYLSAYASIRPSAMTRHQYGREDLGGWFAFATDVGIQFHLTESLMIGYVWQHISNANIYHDNPGVNFHIFELSLRF